MKAARGRAALQILFPRSQWREMIPRPSRRESFWTAARPRAAFHARINPISLARGNPLATCSSTSFHAKGRLHDNCGDTAQGAAFRHTGKTRFVSRYQLKTTHGLLFKLASVGVLQESLPPRREFWRCRCRASNLYSPSAPRTSGSLERNRWVSIAKSDVSVLGH